jgi:hypothetical protein
MQPLIDHPPHLQGKGACLCHRVFRAQSYSTHNHEKYGYHHQVLLIPQIIIPLVVTYSCDNLSFSSV